MFFILCISFLIHTSVIASDNTENTKANREYGFATNQGKNSYQEDRIVCCGDQSTQYRIVGVLDGHTGDTVVKLVSEKLKACAAKNEKPSEESILELFKKINHELRYSHNVGNYDGGSTASLGFVDNAEIYCAQLGDSQIIDSNGKRVFETHTPYNEKEVKRVEASNGQITYFDGGWRLSSGLAVTRSFGDFHSAEIGLSAIPEVKKITLNPNDFLIFATDGVTDELSPVFMAEHVKERINGTDVTLSRIAKELTILASYNCMLNPNGSLPAIIKQELIDLKNKIKMMTPEELARDYELYDYLKQAYDNQSVFIVYRKS